MNQYSRKERKKRDWDSFHETAKDYTVDHGKFRNAREIARAFSIPRSTFFDAIKRGDFNPEELLMETDVKTREQEQNPVKTRIKGNTASIKYKAGEPLSKEDLFELTNLDPDEWKVVDERINAWQVGRKGRKVQIDYVDGKATGSIDDSGEINKEYLFQIELKLTRVKRIPVKAIIQPISLNLESAPPSTKTVVSDNIETEILFVTDPHFGFIRDDFGNLLPFQDREFLGGLMGVSDFLAPDIVIFNGDALDLPDASSFNNDPAILNNLQAAGIELSFVLNEFRGSSSRTVLIEGNHEERLNRLLKQNFQAAFNLKPIHDLGGAPMMSIPRFLGLKEIGIEWVGDYPDGFVQVGKARFSHGNIVRAGSGKTASAIAMNATISKFFGHIHRFELVQKHIEDLETDIFIGSPGCSCLKNRVPGAKRSANWQTGAFYITLDIAGNVAEVETIQQDITTGGARMRGMVFNNDYFPHFSKSLEGRWGELFGSA